MHNRRVGRDIFTVEVRPTSFFPTFYSCRMLISQWAKNTPSSSWRFDGGRDRGPRDVDRGYDRDRDRDYRRDPPRRRSPVGDRGPRGGDASPSRRDDRNVRRRSYSRSPPGRSPPRRDRDRSRSPKPSDRKGDRDRDDREDREDRDDLRDVRRNGDDLGTHSSSINIDMADKYDDKELVED